MTILAVVKSVCATVGVEIPTSVFAGGTANRTMTEMLDHANEMAQRIASDSREWSRLKTSTTFVGDGVTTAFNLPADYKRMLLTSNVWSSTSTQSPMRFISDTDEWMRRRASFYTDSTGEWAIYGGQMHIYPAMSVGASASFAYLSKNCIELNSGGVNDTFMNDADVFLLDERLLKLGMIWQWKSHKGSPYAEDLGTYQDAMLVAMGFDGPSPIFIGRSPLSSAVHANVAVPAYTIILPASP